jgi:outer membrane murein-binding lipoprotein Lpp
MYKSSTAALLALSALLAGGATHADQNADDLHQRISALEAQVEACEAERNQTARHLDIFDELDLVASNDRDMERIGEIHAEYRVSPLKARVSPQPRMK